MCKRLKLNPYVDTPLGLSVVAIKQMWQHQSPPLVITLQKDGRLDARLTEAPETASAVRGAATQRGMSPDQARELAQDAIGLRQPQEGVVWPTDLDDLDGEGHAVPAAQAQRSDPAL